MTKKEEKGGRKAIIERETETGWNVQLFHRVEAPLTDRFFF